VLRNWWWWKVCLSGFETLKVCTDYNYKGKNSSFPLQHEPENVTPVYKNLRLESWFNWYDYVWELPIELKVYWVIEKEVKFLLKLFLWDQIENKLSLNKIKNALIIRAFF
jgi:adenylosuccinate synthase